MPRPKKTDHAERLEVRIPESVLTKVRLELYSELEGRVPFGAASDLVTQLFRGWLEERGVKL